MANITGPSNVALNALQKLQNVAADGAPENASSFGDILKTAAQSAINAQHASEKVSAAALVGKADMTEVLQAVNNAELALNTVLAIRDRVVQAYEAIMRTSI